jgi:PhzF family phenazine biosynthesis protein
VSHPLWIVDAFTDRPFAGNPAAVCLLDAPASPEWMQHVAREMNLSETAFVQRKPDPPVFGLRWFTPTVEVRLCGHATLASAHFLWEEGLLPPDAPALFDTLSGRLSAVRSRDVIEMDFPAKPMTRTEAPPGLEEALGVPLVSVHRDESDFLVELADERTVRALEPDHAALARLPLNGVIVTAQAGAGEAGAHDFVSRFFGPGYGVAEDPVTGIAHCCLGPFWAPRLGRDEMTGYQASARGGHVTVRLRGRRVWLGGRAVTVLRGDLLA